MVNDNKMLSDGKKQRFLTLLNSIILSSVSFINKNDMILNNTLERIIR